MGRPKVDSVTNVWQRTDSKAVRGGIGHRLVVAGDDPDLARMLDAHLGRAQDVSGGMQREGDAVERGGLPEREPGHLRLGSQTAPKHAEPFVGCQVGAASPGDVVAVGVGDHGPVHGPPGIHEEIAGLAVQAALGEAQQRHRPCDGPAQRRSITPQTTRSPELPLGSVFSSSGSAWITNARCSVPSMDAGPGVSSVDATV